MCRSRLYERGRENLPCSLFFKERDFLRRIFFCLLLFLRKRESWRGIFLIGKIRKISFVPRRKIGKSPLIPLLSKGEIRGACLFQRGRRAKRDCTFFSIIRSPFSILCYSFSVFRCLDRRSYAYWGRQSRMLSRRATYAFMLLCLDAKWCLFLFSDSCISCFLRTKER